MVRQLACAAWFLLTWTTHTQAGELHFAFDKTEVEWGKPLRGQVIYRGAGATDSVDLAPWKARFHLETGYSEHSKDETGAVLRRESVRLYARAPGDWRLPALTHAGTRSQPLDIQVLPPRPDGKDIALSHVVSAERISAGQQVTIRVRLVTADARVRVDIDPLEATGVVSQLLAARRGTLPDDGGVVHQLGWSLHLGIPGRHVLELPPVRYVLFGQTLYKFYLPLLHIQVDALPDYVPLTVPVGGVALHSTIEDRDGIRGWRVTLETDGLLPVGAPALESALAELAGVPQERVHKSQRQDVRDDGVYQILELHAPLPVWLGRPRDAPQLSLQWFDPAARRVQRLRHDLPQEWRAPPWFTAAMALLGAGSAALVGSLLWRTWRRRRSRRELVAAVLAAPDAHALRRLLMAPTHCRTLSEWAAHRGGEQVASAAARLNAARFGRSGGELMALKYEIADLLRLGESDPGRRPRGPRPLA